MQAMTGNSATDVRQLFDRIAPVYDDLNDWLSLGQHRIWKKMAVRWIHPQPGQTVLDLCCGSGDLAIMLARCIAPTGRVFGVDFACVQLEIAAKKLASYPNLKSCVTWQVGDALALPFENATFDGATMSYGLRNVVSIPQCLAELYRVLKPGAIAAILDFHRPADKLIAKFQQFYLDRVVVKIAELKGMTEEYEYIAPSLARFPIGREQEKLAIAAGFDKATHYAIANGMMGILVLEK
jgi:demethylmenaquinone methyltransferase/2-methoxy-6-polyprenyl-1,4-benzoquinol methylase